MKSLLFLLVIVTKISYSQDYVFKRAVFDGQIVKIEGTISITDSLISIKHSNQPIANYPVQVYLKKDEFTQYKVLTDKESTMHIFIQPNQLNTKIENYSMTININDKLNDWKGRIVYFLIPKD